MNSLTNDYEDELDQDSVDDQTEPELASRWARLGAVIIDTVLLSIVLLPILYFAGLINFTPVDPNVSPWNQPVDHLQNFINALVGLMCYLAINAYFIFTSQQTVGKYVLDIQVVADSGEPTTGNHYVFVRYVPMYFISLIPIIGGIIGLINVLFIFRSSRKCLHDDIAKTIVIKLKPSTTP